MRAPVPGGELYYTSVGCGPTMLVMHGGLGLDHTYFRPWLDPLGEDATLVFYDHRGSGRSSRPASWSDVDHATFRADADALRRHLAVDSVIAFGHSYGGIIALQFARAYPDHVRGLVLCCAQPVLDYGDAAFAQAAARAAPAQLAALQRVFSGPIGDDQTWAELARTILPLYFHAFDPEHHGALFDDVHFSAGAYDRSAALLGGFNALPWLADVAVPTLVLSGADDWLSPTAFGAKRFARGLPHAEVVEFRDSGHFPFVEENAAFLTAVRRWLHARIASPPESG